MRPNRYFTTALFVSVLSLVLALPALAQYGTGVVHDVPFASGEIVLDGVDDEADWGFATFIDLVEHWEAGWDGTGYGDPDTPDAVANARLLWREGVLYIYIYVEQLSQPLFFNDNPFWEGSQLLVGVDLTHAGDDQTDDSWGGWPENAPNLGPVAYKLNPAHPFDFTLNWGQEVDPVDAGYVDGVIVVDEENDSWVVEMAIFGAEITADGQIGFNAAGGVGAEDAGPDGWMRTYGWFVHSICEGEGNCQFAGGVAADAGGYVSLNFVGAPGEGYGTGAVQQVGQATGPIVLDGVMDEAAWEEAVEVDLTNFWNSGYYEGWGDPDVPDVFATAKLLWDDDVLYLFIHSEHAVPMLFMPASENPWDANQILVGVDLTYEGDGQTDGSWSGWPWNAPDLGPTTYKINPEFGGITLNWGDDIDWMEPPWENVDPVAAGFVDGAIVVDEVAQTWSVEMAIFGEQIQEGALIGFNVGGAASNEEMCAPIGPIGECTYAWFSWQARAIVSAGGDVTFTTDSFGSLHFVPKVSGEEGATAGAGFIVRENFPNPFGAATTIVYELERDGAVELGLYDVLGRRIALVDEGPRAAGEHQVRLDGSGLASGLYMVRLSVDGQPAATHMMMRVH